MKGSALVRVLMGAAFSLVMGIWLFQANLHTDDTGILAGLILIGSAVAAALLPSRWWPLAISIASSVILSELYRRGGSVNGGFVLVALAILAFSLTGIGGAAAARLLFKRGG